VLSEFPTAVSAHGDHTRRLACRLVRRAPALSIAHPTEEHFRPLLVAAGAASDDPVGFILEGWEFGSLSRRTVQFG